MICRLPLLLVMLLCASCALCAQDAVRGVTVALNRGSVKGLEPYMGEQVSLIVQRQTTRVDRQQALELMSDFFSQVRVSAFELRHQGRREGSCYLIGILSTARGDYRVNCFFKPTEEGAYTIRQIKIDQANE